MTTARAPEPSDLRDGEVLIELSAVGICGSDVPKFLGGNAEPLPGWPAHEIVGTVIRSRGTRLRAGQRVAGLASNHNGLAQRIISTSETLVAVDGQFSDEEAIVIQPLATVHAALSRVRKLQGARVTVIGLGPLGLLLAHLARDSGAALVTGIDRVDRHDVASDFGLHEVVWSGSRAWAASVGAGQLADVVVEAVGHQAGTLNDAIAAAALDGHVVGFGVPDDSHYALDYLALFRKRLTLTAGTTYPWQRYLHASQQHLLKHSDLARRLVTHTLPAAQAQRGYELAARPDPAVRKVVIDLSRSAWRQETRSHWRCPPPGRSATAG
jgi:threonine dehydrogenase-like Zn-dependent dehydrogenase